MLGRSISVRETERERERERKRKRESVYECVCGEVEHMR